MKKIKLLRYNIKYLIFVLMLYFVVKIFHISDKIIRYVRFETTNIKFQDLLSVGITILAIFVGAIITVATILISMCDKRIMKLLNSYGKTNYLISSIKTSIVAGITSTCLFAIVYAKLDYNILILRLCILYLSGLALFTFIYKSNILVKLVVKILNHSFKGEDSIIVEEEFKKP